MITRGLFLVVLAVGFAGCGDDMAVTEVTSEGGGTTGMTGATGTTVAPTGSTSDMADTSTGPGVPTTSGEPASTSSTNDPGSDTGGTTVGVGTTGGTTGTDDTTVGASTTGNETTDASTTGTGGDGTTGDPTAGGPFACVEPTDSDTAADPSGWSRSHGVPDAYLSARQLAVAGDGSVVFATQFSGVIDLGDGPIDTGGANHVVLARYDVGGELQWSTQIGGGIGTLIDHLTVVVDCGGNVVIGGSFDGDITTQGTTLKVVPGYRQQADIIYGTSDMFLAQYGVGGGLRWARSFGDTKWQRIHELDVQSDGTIVIGGASEGTLELGGAPIVGDERFVGVLAAFDADGVFVWQRSFAGLSDVAVERLAVGPGDRLSAYGHAGTVVDLGGGDIPYEGINKWVGQFEPDGAHRWAQHLLDQKHSVFHLGADSAGGLVLAGDHYPGNGVYGGFVLRHDDTGTLLWTRHFDPAPKSQEFFELGALAVDDDIAIAGWLRGSFDLGDGELDSPGYTPYVARYDLAGAPTDASRFPGSPGAVPNSAARGPDGELVIGGQFKGDLDLGAGPVKSVGQADVFVHRFGP